jgi:hypothetical protein
MIEKGLILTGSDAELLSRALSEVKTKVYEKSGAKLDDNQALDALVSYFLNAEWWTGKTSLVFTPLRKCLVLGTIIDMKGNADRVWKCCTSKEQRMIKKGGLWQIRNFADFATRLWSITGCFA